MRRPAPEPEAERPRQDIQLDPGDREDLLIAIAGAYATSGEARRLLGAIGYPRGAIPAWTEGSPEDWWDQVFAQLDAGRIPEGYRRLLARAAGTYGGNRTLYDLHARYIGEARAAGQADGERPRCHVFVQAGTEAERAEALATLQRLDLDPLEEFATDLVTSYSVSSPDQQFVRSRLSQTELPWTVASADGAHYLLHTLFVQGPDGSRFRLRDTPASTTFGTIASEVVATQYPGTDAEAIRPTVINQIKEDGQQERADPDQTLADAGVADGSQVQIGFESRAGSVVPRDWEDALARVRGQITAYASSHGIRVVANSDTMPTRYDLTFQVPSFGPPPPEGGEPTWVQMHTVRIVLPQGFPVTSPRAYWLTPFFHPNVFPTYDCQATLEYPEARGLACLGKLADSWYPAIDFSEVCRVIIDMAAYRNYDVFGFDPANPRDAPHVNFYDRLAAEWAVTHQEEIEKMGGAPVLPFLREGRQVRRMTIERLD